MDNSNPIDQTNSNDVTPSASPTVEPVVNQAQATDPNSLFAHQLASIKTDDGRQKYADVPTALNSIPHAQGRIAEQAEEIRKLQEELAKRQGAEEILKQLKSQQAPVEQPSNVGIDETTIAQMLDKRLTQRETEAKQNANASQVLNHLKTTFGDKAESQFNAKAQQLGLSVQQLSDLARQAPQAALAFFNAPAPSPANPTMGSVNTNVLQTKPQQPDNATIFNGGTSPSIQSWRAAAAKS